MRHHRAGKKLGRDSAHRKALYANLAGALIEHGRIKTTVAKAKAVKPFAEQMITLGKRGDLHARRQALATSARRTSSTSSSPRSRRASPTGPAATRASSRSGRGQGDAAEMAYLELVDYAPGAGAASRIGSPARGRRRGCELRA